MSHRFVDHVGEVEVELEAADRAGIFEAALAAVAELLASGPAGEPVSRLVELASDEPALLLVDWLNELVFLAEVERFVPERVASLEVGERRLRATVEGRTGDPRHLVKAVTLSRLALGPERGRWRGRVVLDV